MHPTHRVDASLRALIHAQAGAFSSRQAIAHGFSPDSIRRMVGEGRWDRVAPGVLREAGATAWLTKVWAGYLAAGDGAVIGGLAAGHLSGLWSAEPDRIAYWVGRRRVQVSGPWDFRRGSRDGRGQLVRVVPEQAVMEACAGVDADRAVSLLLEALGSRRLSTSRMRDAVAGCPRQRHGALLREVLSEWQDGVESPLEARYRRDVERAHRLPTGARQVRLSAGTRSDVLYEEEALVVELDGRLGHEGDDRFRDAERDNRHTVAGFATLRFGWRDVVGRPCAVAGIVAGSLRSRGWAGDLRPCERCC